MAGFDKEDFQAMDAERLAECVRGEPDGIAEHERDYAFAQLIDYFDGNEAVAHIFQQFGGVPVEEAESFDVDIPDEHVTG